LIYFIGPFLGSILAVALYQFLKSEPVLEEEDDVEEEEIEDEAVELSNS
jgi:hypothetical protein